MPLDAGQSLDIGSLMRGYRRGAFTPGDVVELLWARSDAAAGHNAWITRLSAGQVQPYLRALEDKSPERLPLYGIPFAIKDNIDLAGVPTTAACPAYAHTPERDAFVVECLIEAGAIPVGKTNLDQFATGLVGVRSPYGACRNSFDPEYIAGGSSSGSAVAVAAGLASFALGTDTAGSGRVPAAFNNIVGIKPTRGLLSNRGVVPACKSLDCVSVFALCMDDANAVSSTCARFDPLDGYARPAPVTGAGFNTRRFRFGVPHPQQQEFFGNREAHSLFQQTVERLESLGGEPVGIDFAPFQDAARLLYEGPWLAERYAAIEDFIERHPEALHPVTRELIMAGKRVTAVEAFKGQYRLMEYRRATEQTWREVDLLLTPTAGTLYRIGEVEADPLRLNSNLGYYTNFMNLLDLCAIAVPAGLQGNGLPFGVTLAGPAFSDTALAVLADRLHRLADLPAGATGLPLPRARGDTTPLPGTGLVPIAVCGAHLSGLPLNGQLTERGAFLMEATRTAAAYRLYALSGGPPYRPGLVRDSSGTSIEVEVWAMPQAQVGSFLPLIPAPLGLGQVELSDGRWVSGFICEPCGIEGAVDVTRYGGWRGYLAAAKG
jgi:allophanate hydrolase